MLKGRCSRGLPVALAASLLTCACGGGPSTSQTGAIPPVQERSYRVSGQTQDIVYVPVLRFEKAEWKARMEDTLGALPSLEACKAALAERAAKPLSGQFAGYKVTEHVCYEVTKSGEQKKIVVGQG